MTTKLNNYNLPDETINVMKSILHKSVQTKTEHGLTLCADQNDNLKAKNICAGESCSIEINGKCDLQEKFAGTYHTHPNSYSNASARDLIYCGAIPNICIGGERDNKIMCYTWKHDHITEDKYNNIINMSNKGIRQTDNPTYEKTFDCVKEFGPIVHTEKMMREGDKNVNMLFQLLQMAKQIKIPESIIGNMEEAIKSKLHTRRTIVDEMNKSSAELAQKYYKNINIC
jgi:hypothetical protein